ncbi:hypothetical protein MP228_007263 [Amoeboaphelidium protococcarum]|nr:hypothetical protein MP228_007263 [Amoeboaphelidium protococcarum]
MNQSRLSIASLQSKRSISSRNTFDSYKFVNALQQEGFNAQQSEAILQVVSEVLQSTIDDISKDSVQRQSVSQLESSHRIDFAQLRADLQMLERSDFASLKAENDQLASEIEKLNQKVREDLNRLYSSTRLDLNLERGKIFDDHSELLHKLNEADAKIQQETSQIRASIGNVQFDTMRTLLTTASTVGLVILGYMRLFK